ncbi:MAG: cytochrome c [Desulfuromonadaceae bacterium]|nr:cytochrome c [Desulfuromonadaceae bacterium]
MGNFVELRFTSSPVHIFIVGFVMMAALACSGCNSAQNSDLTPEQRQLRTGKELFDKSCSPCHGAHGNGMGARSGPSLQRTEYRYGSGPAEIYTSISAGRNGGMPPFSSIYTADQIEALVQYTLYLRQ